MIYNILRHHLLISSLLLFLFWEGNIHLFLFFHAQSSLGFLPHPLSSKSSFPPTLTLMPGTLLFSLLQHSQSCLPTHLETPSYKHHTCGLTNPHPMRALSYPFQSLLPSRMKTQPTLNFPFSIFPSPSLFILPCEFNIYRLSFLYLFWDKLFFSFFLRNFSLFFLRLMDDDSVAWKN